MSPEWHHTVKIKHLLTDNKDHDSVQSCMNMIADVLARHSYFSGFALSRFRKIPQGDDVFCPQDYANRLLSKLYDYSDEHRIWIE